MRPPPIQIRILGHPIVAMPVTGMGLFILWQWTQHPDLGVIAIGALAAMAVVGKANARRMAYVRWRRAWDSMADAEPATARGPKFANAAIALILPAGLLAYESGKLDGVAGPLVSLGLLGLAFFAGRMMVRRWRRSGHRAPAASRSDVVSVCARPVIAVPSMTDAYSALPAHCWHVLNSGAD
ncbi:hypothetical protein [Sphingopyxis sp. GC21]|uniref:hypothetical protein n=1 Tax=Sphingopyxis sp. GC21 TaxID=2933562 RepID=UPI0021E4EDEF|nr:hypothetical protein [Sphingopyxis sp. GC21]